MIILLFFESVAREERFEKNPLLARGKIDLGASIILRCARFYSAAPMRVVAGAKKRGSPGLSAEPVIGRRFAPTRWRRPVMTKKPPRPY
jgi:hypothetical protein